MAKLSLSILALTVLLLPLAAALETTNPQFLVLPPPQAIRVENNNDKAENDELSLRVHPENFRFQLTSATLNTLSSTPLVSSRLSRMMSRYMNYIHSRYMYEESRSSLDTSSSSFCNLTTVNVHVFTNQGYLNAYTDYSYTLSITNCTAIIKAVSIYGAQYGMESFTQLLRLVTTTKPQQQQQQRFFVIPYTLIEITDSPAYAWRGLMIDSGRRFFPVSLVENLLDTMAGNKMNVLHLHASDMCRFGVESLKYKNLTDALVGILSGYYSQADIASLISYASDRGIRIVPEFDIPGHSRGFIPLINEGIQFCEPNDPTKSQLYGDAQNQTLTILTDLFTEMASLFSDDVFHIGSDETSALGPCTVQSTFALEREVLDYVADTLQKTPAGWEEVLFDAGAATMNTTVYSWSRHAPVEITSTGRNTVASNASHFYFTGAAPGGPDGWSTCWYDIGTDIPSDQLPLLLGGEMSMWSDTYCYIEQCGAFNGPTPYAAALFDPQLDNEFSSSIGGMIWPRGYVGAAAFYNYNASVNPADPAFVAAIWSLNDQLQSRGSYVCPTNCSCDQLSACGVPYIKPIPPAYGAAITAVACDSGIGVGQKWIMNSDGSIALAANTSLCIQDPGAQVYPLSLGLCSNSNIAKWTHNANTSEIIQQATGLCMDLRESDNAIGTYTCGSGEGLKQLNQEWAMDTVSGVTISFFNGACMTASNGTTVG